MPTRRTVMRAAALALGVAALHARAIMGTAAAGDASAHAFVASIYDTYKGKDANGIVLKDDGAIRRYFQPFLASLIIKDRKTAARRHEAPTLDGDPFVDAQDWDIAAFSIEITDKSPGKAGAKVSFHNGEKPTTVGLDLIKVKGDWRIADIAWEREGKTETLRGLLGH